MKETTKNNCFLNLAKDYSSYKNSQIVLLPIYYSNPNSFQKYYKEIVKASINLEHYDDECCREISFEKGICTFEPLEIKTRSFAKIHEKIFDTSNKILSENKFTAALLSNNFLSAGLIKSSSHKYSDLSVLHLDAFANLKSDSESKSIDDKSSRLISEYSNNILQVGIRSISRTENNFRKGKNIHQFTAGDIKLGIYGSDWQEIVNNSLTQNVYISLNFSVFDPSVFPAVNNPQPNGLLWDEILYLIKVIGIDRNIVGIDLSGYKPNKNYPFMSYFIAKLLYKIFNYKFCQIV